MQSTPIHGQYNNASEWRGQETNYSDSALAPPDASRGDQRAISRRYPPNRIHLVRNQPAYFDLKPEFTLPRKSADQLGRISFLRKFLDELDRVWREYQQFSRCQEDESAAVVGQFAIARKEKYGRRYVAPRPSDIQVP